MFLTVNPRMSFAITYQCLGVNTTSTKASDRAWLTKRILWFPPYQLSILTFEKQTTIMPNTRSVRQVLASAVLCRRQHAKSMQDHQGRFPRLQAEYLPLWISLFLHLRRSVACPDSQSMAHGWRAALRERSVPCGRRSCRNQTHLDSILILLIVRSFVCQSVVQVSLAQRIRL